MHDDHRLRISVGINVALGVVVGALAFTRSHGDAAGSEVRRALPSVPGATVVSPPRPKLPPAEASAAGPQLRHALVDQLRTQGVPENVLARFAYTDIEEAWAGRFDDCRGDQTKLARVQLEHDMGLDAEMRQALGDAGFRRWDQHNLLREAMLGSQMALRPEEADAIYDLKKKLQQRQWELSLARQEGKMDDADISKANDEAYTDFGQQMKAVLGEARYAQAMRGDDGSSALKDSLAKVNATDGQFQQLLTAQQQMNERRTALDREFQNDPSSELYAQRIKTLTEEQNEAYRRVLGDAVFDTLQKQQDGSYMKMKQFSDVWNLDEAKIDAVYGALKYYQKTVEDYQDQAHLQEAHGQNTDWTAVDKNVQQFAEQTRQSLRKYLGDANYDRMQQSGVFPFANQQSTHPAPGQ